MIKLTVGGESVRPDELGDALMKTVVSQMAQAVRDRLSAIRRPDTGELPTVVVSGETLETLSFIVEGSRELLALVRDRLIPEDLKLMTLREESKARAPRAFLSYAWEDWELAEQLANALQSKGIETWWAQWEINAGDSLRQKIDQGLSECTHFLVLLTPTSITKPWVNQEMDAGLVRKLEEAARFIPVRHGLSPNALPPLLSGMLSPAIDDFDFDVRQLVNDIHGVSRKPPLGEAPVPVSIQATTGYSAAANAVAKAFVEGTETATFGDPQLSVSDLAERTALSEDDVRDALHELGHLVDASFDRALVQSELFVTFDKHFTSWDPAADALTIAADLVNDDRFPGDLRLIAERYGWPPRRLNPAAAFLINRDLVMGPQALGTHPWLTAGIMRIDATRRFVKSRS